MTAIEEAWNGFLLRPLDMTDYIQEFQSPWTQACFDVGNVRLCGYPQDRIGAPGGTITELKGGAEACLRDQSRCVDRWCWSARKGRRVETNWLLKQANIW